MASVSTRITSSTSSRHKRKVSLPHTAELPHRSQINPLARISPGGRFATNDTSHPNRPARRQRVPLRIQPLHIARYAGNQPAAANRHRNGVNTPGTPLKHFHADRSWPGNHVRIIIGMRKLLPYFCQFYRVLVSIVIGIAMQGNCRTQRHHRIIFDSAAWSPASRWCRHSSTAWQPMLRLAHDSRQAQLCAAAHLQAITLSSVIRPCAVKQKTCCKFLRFYNILLWMRRIIGL